MTIQTRKKGKITILDLNGPLTLGEGDAQLRDVLKQQLDAGETLFIFNMRDVNYLDSAGIGELVACNKRVCERHGTIKLVLNPKGRQILMVPQVHRIFDLFDDVEAALASFAS
ncbi:MAG TPA: STAS domain-containing protein [Candidatus Polarisedimenticolaceae bacterium]|nr:STAS domain-containing protein [Candidatus Polarisedimenticolaceae bacterium]